MSVDYAKLKKKQLTNLITSKDDKINQLQEQVNNLENDLIKEKENNVVQDVDTLDISKVDQEIIDFYQERIENTIYKELIWKYEKDLKRILRKYE